MGLTSYRFTEFNDLTKLNPLGLEGDLDAIKLSLKSIEVGTLNILQNEIKEMQSEMENDIIIDDTIVQSNVDYLDYISSRQASNIIHNSMMISIFSFLETRLLLLCKLIEPRNSILLNDISGKGIYKYKKFLSKVHSIDFSSQQNEWELITSYALLRNKLVHSQSVDFDIKKNSKEYIKLKKIEHLTVKEYSDKAFFYIDSQEFHNKYFQTVSKFLEFICYI
ncbi:hypothetical protein F7018_03920 [Tenacibaculum aiptasiae]|uniref:RiboL-PSP-HEPN domain-containing protein n=1 Tax=Tenacibaculum aiptasiae TaxID=426481 RepID=A0A7J5APE3_9FLAO|nr:hypothetical protein [Tenacibaculum aiptasiae]KAB1159469.1 hypothetical protein F7018_03920 [Tenacibaculum aiptasiae]